MRPGRRGSPYLPPGLRGVSVRSLRCGGLRTLRKSSRWLAAAAFAAVAGEAMAQSAEGQPPPSETAAAGAIVYPPSFFAQYRPVTAMDMIQRLPGFTFAKGDEVRGFGGAAGNVLIDGERPSTKSIALDQLLGRIPVSSVERVELIRGGAPGIDMQGQSVVANVIRRTTASSSIAVQHLTKPYTNGFVGIVPRVEGNLRRGGLALDGLLSWRKDQHTDTGDGILVRRNAAGAILNAGEFDSDVLSRILQASGAAEYRRSVDVFRLNLSGERNDIEREEAALLADPSGRFSERTRTTQRADKAEIGVDYQRDIRPWLDGQLIALKTFKGDRLNSLSRTRSPSQQTNEDSTSGETIFRGVLSAVRSDALRFEGGGEAAFNYLDARSSLFVGGAPVALPSANVRIEESRTEAFFTTTWKPSARFSAEGGVRWETSTIRQTGGAQQEKRLSFPKPRLILSYAATPATQLRLRLERTVGQLNFRDFAASAQVEAGTVNAGNPDLEPERAWLAEVAVERRFWNGGALVLTLTHSEVQQVVDLIPIDGRFDAPGNIGDGTRDEAKLSLTLPLERFGLKRASVRFNGTWRRSSVTDPVTGRNRRISNQRPFEGDFVITKSLPSLNSSVSLEASHFGYTETAYRISEVRTTTETPLYKLIWDWSARPDLTFRFQIENFAPKRRVRERVLFSGIRSANAVNVREKRYAEQAPFLMIRVRKTFAS